MPPLWFTLLKGARGPTGSPPPPMTTFHGALITRSTDQAIVTSDFVSFDTVVFDTDSFFDLAHPTRLTIPTTGKYAFGTNIEVADVTATVLITVARNADGITLLGAGDDATRTFGQFAASGVLDFTAGDFIEVGVGTDLAASITVTADGNLPQLWVFNYT